MNVYQQQPNIVTVTITDDTGTSERYFVGKTLDEVVALIDPGAPVKPKQRRKRRTKAEMETATRTTEAATSTDGAESKIGTDEPEATPARGKKSKAPVWA